MVAIPFDSSFAARPAARAGGRLLQAAEYVVVKGQFVAPGRHRLLLAGGLSAGLFGGRAMMNVITGQHPDGSPIHREDVALPLRPLTGLMPYNPFSDNPRDRWRKALDNLAPAAFGAIGVVAASRFHFRDRIAAGKVAEDIAYGVKKGVMSFDKIEQAISMKQAEPIAAITAVGSLPGSASGANLTPLGYGPLLSALFSLRADRKVGMGVLHPLSSLTRTVASSPLGAADMMHELWHHLLANPEAGKDELRELGNLGGGVLKSMIRGVTPEHVEQWKDELVAERGAIVEGLRAEAALGENGKPIRSSALIERVTQACWEHAERFGVRHGLIDMRSPETVKASLHIGDNGLIGGLAEKMSRQTRAEAEALRENYARAVYQRHLGYAKEVGVPHGAPLIDSELHVAKPVAPNRARRYAALTAAGVAASGLVGYGASRGDHEERARVETASGHQDRLAHLINGVPLTVTEWVGNALNFPPGLHRLKNAVGLSAGMYGGMKLGEAVTGLTLFGKNVAKEAVLPPLRPLYKKLSYEFQGLDPSSRWMKVAHFAIPAIGGFYGSKFGSDLYFSAQRERNRRAEFIDDYANKISYDQSEPWSYLSAVTSLANVGLGLSFLPIGYGMDLGTRFSLGSGRKIVLPGVKEAWSNNHSRYPLGPTQLRDYMVNYLVNNPDAEARQLQDMVRGILNPWFGEQPESMVQQFASQALAVRKEFYQEGGVPKDQRAACKRALRHRFAGQGLHDTLSGLGLDVLQARLADNGLSGDIANHLGAGRQVERDLSDFRAKEIERRTHPALAAPREPEGEHHIPSFIERLQRDRDQQQGTSPSPSV